MRTGNSRGDGYRLINLLYRSLEAKGFLLSSCKNTGCPTAEEGVLKSDILACLIPAFRNTSKQMKNKDVFCCQKNQNYWLNIYLP